MVITGVPFTCNKFFHFFIFSNNRVLKVELETYKIRVKVLQEENRTLRQASVTIVCMKMVLL